MDGKKLNYQLNLRKNGEGSNQSSLNTSFKLRCYFDIKTGLNIDFLVIVAFFKLVFFAGSGSFLHIPLVIFGKLYSERQPPAITMLNQYTSVKLCFLCDPGLSRLSLPYDN